MEINDFENFAEVWQRVTELHEPQPLPSEYVQPKKENTHEEKLCLIKRCENSRAVRFLPKF